MSELSSKVLSAATFCYYEGIVDVVLTMENKLISWYQGLRDPQLNIFPPLLKTRGGHVEYIFSSSRSVKLWQNCSLEKIVFRTRQDMWGHSQQWIGLPVIGCTFHSFYILEQKPKFWSFSFSRTLMYKLSYFKFYIFYYLIFRILRPIYTFLVIPLNLFSFFLEFFCQ